MDYSFYGIEHFEEDNAMEMRITSASNKEMRCVVTGDVEPGTFKFDFYICKTSNKTVLKIADDDKLRVTLSNLVIKLINNSAARKVQYGFDRASLTTVSRMKLNEYIKKNSTSALESNKTVIDEHQESVVSKSELDEAVKKATALIREHAIDRALDARDEKTFKALVELHEGLQKC